MNLLANYINGELVPPASGEYFDNVDPATGQAYSAVPDSDERDVERAVQAARGAFPAWSGASAEERSRHLQRLAELIDEHFEHLAHAECLDTGKPLWLTRNVDIPRAAANLRFFATAILHTSTEAFLTEGAVSGGGGSGERALNYVIRQPRGVAGCISPWNLPLYLFTWKIAPALATGNTVVGKPSEVTPMTAHILGEIAEQAGFPPGVLNIVHGLGPKVGAAIVSHPEVPAISFTGGTKTGAEIARTAGPMFKKLSLELGGKNPNLVFADADLEEAIPASVRAAFANQGQVCLCGSRILVERSISDRFLEGFVAHARQLKVGDPLEPDTKQGAVVSKQHLEKIESYLALAGEEGGTIECGGKRPSDLAERCRGGYFIEPAVITGLDAGCRVNREEIFGPVATVLPFRDEAEAIEWANATPYGLSATVWTRDLDRAHRVAGALDSGTVWINCWLLRDLRVPFGGMKASGVGREGGEEALRFFTEPKTVCVKQR